MISSYQVDDDHGDMPVPPQAALLRYVLNHLSPELLQVIHEPTLVITPVTSAARHQIALQVACQSSENVMDPYFSAGALMSLEHQAREANVSGDRISGYRFSMVESASKVRTPEWDRTEDTVYSRIDRLLEYFSDSEIEILDHAGFIGYMIQNIFRGRLLQNFDVWQYFILLERVVDIRQSILHRSMETTGEFSTGHVSEFRHGADRQTIYRIELGAITNSSMPNACFLLSTKMDFSRESVSQKILKKLEDIRQWVLGAFRRSL
jgi:hypothetical protein